MDGLLRRALGFEFKCLRRWFGPNCLSVDGSYSSKPGHVALHNFQGTSSSSTKERSVSPKMYLYPIGDLDLIPSFGYVCVYECTDILTDVR